METNSGSWFALSRVLMSAPLEMRRRPTCRCHHRQYLHTNWTGTEERVQRRDPYSQRSA